MNRSPKKKDADDSSSAEEKLKNIIRRKEAENKALGKIIDSLEKKSKSKN